MSKFIEVIAIVEGRTEQIFIEDILAPYLATKKIYIRATQVSKPGQKGGDVRFERVQKDIGLHLKQRSDTYITTLVDYYGIKSWPGLETVPSRATPGAISTILHKATIDAVQAVYAQQRADVRFVPYMAIHEFEALLFSDTTVLASALGVSEHKVISILQECGEPEAINNSPVTAPSKRLGTLSANGAFPKTTKGIAIAKEIGVDRMREKCPLFNSWLQKLESLVGEQV
ncbi:MAG TPA: DUF4276 family protein [Saprospiraceae bacterium]|nr:DUF4276 family protein [Saprospiraceae bacterium]